jgi:hypothetical protein
MQRDAPHGRVQTIADRKWHKRLTPHQKQTSGAEWVRMRATGSTSTRGSEVEGKTIEAETWLLEVEWRMRYQVTENSMTRNDISASTFPGHPRCNSIPSCWVSMVRVVRFCSPLHLLSDTFGTGKHAPKIRTCILYGVMIPSGKCLVNSARCRPARPPTENERRTGLLILVLNNSDARWISSPGRKRWGGVAGRSTAQSRSAAESRRATPSPGRWLGGRC